MLDEYCEEVGKKSFLEKKNIYENNAGLQIARTQMLYL